jgi:hypothetical protein
MGGRREYQLIKTSGGLAGEYADIAEAVFASAAGSAYSPPEEDKDFRRIDGVRRVQLLGACPISVESFQTSNATIRLPANTVTDATDDAGDGRFFGFTNSGTGTIDIEDYLGTLLHKVPQNSKVLIMGNTNNSWDFFVASPSPKSGVVTSILFSGTPRKATVTFAVPYPDTNYSIHFTGTDGRIWSYESKTINGFIINSNSNTTPSEVSWRTSRAQET